MTNFAGRRGTIDYTELHLAFLRHQEMNDRNRTEFEFDPFGAKRHTWHGKRCTVLAREGGVVRMDGMQTLYELVPMEHVRIDQEIDHG